jgi:hypothetical protein
VLSTSRGCRTLEGPIDLAFDYVVLIDGLE